MKIALVNADEESSYWANHVQAGSRHQIAVVYGAAPSLFGADCERRPADQWEALLHETEVDAVLLGTGNGLVVEQLTRIVQAGLPMIVAHPAAGMLDCFSLQMIQRETHSLIYPLVADCDDDAATLLRGWAHDPQESPIGVVEQLVIERALSNRNRENATRQFAIDAFLLRRVLGGFEKFSAVGIDPTKDDWSRLRIQMVSDRGSPVSWGMVGSPDARLGTLTLLGSEGSARVLLERFPEHWRIQVGATSDALALEQPSQADPFDLVARAIERGDPCLERWDDACRSLELADTIEYSARRGKTVDLYETAVTEAGTFRGMMAAGGCLLLLVTLAATLLLAVIESVWSIGGPMRYIPWALLATALTIFVALQILSFALPKNNGRSA